MANDRIFWACKAVAVDGAFLNGVQSVGVSSSIDRVFQSDEGRHYQKFIYETKDKTHTINISRVLSSGDSLFHPCASHVIADIGYDKGTFATKDIAIVYGQDDTSNIGNSGSYTTVTYYKCRITSISYSMTAQGSLTEEITLESRIAKYGTSGASGLPTSPQSATTLRRKYIDILSSTLPSEVTTAFTNGLEVDSQTVYGIQEINIQLTFTYTNIVNYGSPWSGYDADENVNDYFFLQMPVGISCSFTGLKRDNFATFDIGKDSPASELADNKSIAIVTSDFTFNLGAKNYLSDFSESGADAGGSNASITLTYENKNNDFTTS
jgi:hypothetical protein